MTRDELDELIRLARDEEILGELGAERRHQLLCRALSGVSPISDAQLAKMSGEDLAVMARMIADNLRGLE